MKTKTYLFTYFSKGNSTTRSKVSVKAVDLVEAQDKFFSYLRQSSFYSYMWNIEITCELIESSVE